MSRQRPFLLKLPILLSATTQKATVDVMQVMRGLIISVSDTEQRAKQWVGKRALTLRRVFNYRFC